MNDVRGASCACAYAWQSPGPGQPVANQNGWLILNGNQETYKTHAAGLVAGVVCDSGSGSASFTPPFTVKYLAGGVYTTYLTITQTDINNCSTNQVQNYTNFSLSFCITNKLGTYSYPNVTMHTAGGSTPLTEALASLAPGAHRCFTVTNDVPFYVTYGDTLFTADVPETTLYPSTNVTTTSHSPSTATSGPSGGPVVANPGSTNPSSGTNAVGGSSSLTQLDLNRAADAIIHSQAQNTARIVAGLEDVRDAINANTNGPGDTFDDSAAMMSNVVNAAASSSVTASNAASSAVTTASNGLSSISSSLYGFGGSSVTGQVTGFLGGLSGSLPAGYGEITVTGAVSGPFTIDLGSAVTGEALNPYLGTTWRTWMRLVLLWGTLVAALGWFVNELQRSIAQITAASQLQVNAEAAGAFSLVPGTNIGLRLIVVAAAVAAIVFLPAMILTLATTAFGMATGDSLVTGLGYLATAGGAPTGVINAFRATNEWFPLFEVAVVAVNVIVARFLIAPATSFLCLLMKAIGV